MSISLHNNLINLHKFATNIVKENCSPSQHVILSEIRFVVWDVRNLNPKISRSYELYRRRYSTSKIFKHGFVEFPLVHLAADSWVCALNHDLR